MSLLKSVEILFRCTRKRESVLYTELQYSPDALLYEGGAYFMSPDVEIKHLMRMRIWCLKLEG